MAQILLGPVLTDAPTQKVTDKKTGKVYYKKQILPEGKYNYKGTELDLTADTLKSAVDSFKAGAFDEVPFQFGGKESEHNNDPFRRGGSMVQMEHVPGKGVWGYFDFSAEPKAAQYVEKYPRFGVSPRIVLDMDRADGKKFDVAVQHVCGTSVPRINGMSPWEKVELSEDDSEMELIDLSLETIEAIPTVVPIVTKSEEGEKKVDLTQTHIDFLNQMIAEQAEYEKLAGGDTETQTQTVELPEEVKLSLGAVTEHAKEIAALKANNVRSEWAARRAQLLSAGVPPAQLDLAEPLMLRPESTVIELSTAEGPVQSSDKQQMISLLESMKGTVDLSEEAGHAIGGKEPSEESFTSEEIDAFLNANGI